MTMDEAISDGWIALVSALAVWPRPPPAVVALPSMLPSMEDLGSLGGPGAPAGIGKALDEVAALLILYLFD